MPAIRRPEKQALAQGAWFFDVPAPRRFLPVHR
jgi:hypothetical protein